MFNSPTITTVTKVTVEEFIKKNETTLIYLWHPKCSGCTEILPIIEEISKEYAGKCAFSVMNTDYNGSIDPELKEKYGVDGTPTVIVTWKGSLIAFFFMDSGIIPSAIRLVLNNQLNRLNHI